MSEKRGFAPGSAKRLWLPFLGRGACACMGVGAILSLLAADPADAKKPAKPVDNSYCLVCHANLKKEDLTRVHQKAGVGCAKCHGESDRHSADEDALTPPEIMYARDKIAPACLKCHPIKALADVPDHAELLAKSELGEKVASPLKTCTECHGKHRLAVRTRRWDKTTGKLIADDGVRMMQTNSPASSAR